MMIAVRFICHTSGVYVVTDTRVIFNTCEGPIREQTRNRFRVCIADGTSCESVTFREDQMSSTSFDLNVTWCMGGYVSGSAVVKSVVIANIDRIERN